MSETPAGWYTDPDDPTRQRYWDGQSWTENRTEPAAPATPPPPAAPTPLPAAPAPVKQSHTTRNVILAVIGVFILLVGGCTIALVAAGGKAVNDAVNQVNASNNAPGGPNNPMEIHVGQAFEVQGFNYQPGWSVGNDALGDLAIKGLKVQNNRGSKDSAIVEIKFWNGNEVLALADCTTSPIDPGSVVALSCISTDKLPKSYDKVTINDTF